MHEEEDGLIVLGAHNLQETAEEFVLMMVLFFSQAACAGGECAAMAEECSKAADELYEYVIPVAKVILILGG